MRKDKVVIKDDLLIRLYQVGKAENKPIAVLVDEIIREGLKQRNQPTSDR